MTFFLRLLGWVLVIAAVLAASAEAVLALGPGTHSGIATRDVWTLLSGSAPAFDASEITTVAASTGRQLLNRLGAAIMGWPAWAVIGPLGGALVMATRGRARGHRHRRRFGQM